MTHEEEQLLKELLNKFCRKEINEENCEEDDCEFCAINKAWHRIFEE